MQHAHWISRSLFVCLPFFLAANLGAQSLIRFTDATKSAGLSEPLAGLMGHGGAWGDFDGDGRIDLFVGGFCDRPNAEYLPAKGPVPYRFFRNLGGGRFEWIKGAPAEIFSRTSGAVFADLDNDGTLDLYVANNAKMPGKAKPKNEIEPQASSKFRHNQLFRNSGGKFTDISASSGACPESLFTARNIGVFDYDNDGLLDLFVVEDKFTPKPRSVLLRNLGGMKFKDVTVEVGLPEDIFGLGLAVADLNGDGRPDFFVGDSNRIFLSQPGNRYGESLELRELFAWKPLHREDWPCGAAFGDLNRDGRLDLVLSIHCETARNKVFLNDGVKDGVPQFRDVTKEVGLGDAVPVKCPHVEIQDFDNDGWPDICLSAAWRDGDIITPLIFRNTGMKDGLPRFVPPRPVRAPMVYFPCGPSGDFDNDGRLDLFLINWFAGNHSRLLRNESEPRPWLQVRVTGKQMNRMGIGAQVRLFAAGQLGKTGALLGFQEIGTGYGYASGQPALAHFGLGTATKVDIEIRFPNGKTLQRIGVTADQLLNISEQ